MQEVVMISGTPMDNNGTGHVEQRGMPQLPHLDLDPFSIE
jgi:hypothetical protein